MDHIEGVPEGYRLGDVVYLREDRANITFELVPDEQPECPWCKEGEPEWSPYAKVWIHRRERLDKKCLRPRPPAEQPKQLEAVIVVPIVEDGVEYTENTVRSVLERGITQEFAEILQDEWGRVTIRERENFPNGVRPAEEGRYVLFADYKAALDLLDRFAELYGEVPLVGSMIKPGHKLWRDFYKHTGDHMILTDEGWEPGAVKQSYIDEVGPEAIQDEVNATSAQSGEREKEKE